MASPAHPILPRLEATAPRLQLPALTDELLEEIFIRIASPADLARASTACVSFRRLIADPYFLRRYRSVHPPLLLGLLCKGFEPVQAPHPNAPAARAFVRAANFSFDYYIPPGRWSRWDVRDGRVLLGRSREVVKDGFVFPDLEVCDPLSRRYLLLPPIADGLLASVQVQRQHVRYFEAYLVPSGLEEEDTLFRVIGTALCVEKLVVFIFSSGSGSWSIGTSTNSDALSLNLSPDGDLLHWPNYYAYGCFYWKMFGKNKLLEFNIKSMEFSTVNISLEYARRKTVIVEAGEGRLGMFSRANNEKCL